MGPSVYQSGHSLFFRLASNAFPDTGSESVGLTEKETKIKITKSLGIEGPGTLGRR